MKDSGSRARMDRRAPVSSIERAVVKVLGGTGEEGTKALCWRRASFASESCESAADGSW